VIIHSIPEMLLLALMLSRVVFGCVLRVNSASADNSAHDLGANTAAFELPFTTYKPIRDICNDLICEMSFPEAATALHVS
jgi:hypothetical protein